jgi:hypothetical protein
VYGVVPPVPVAVKVTAAPMSPVVGPDTVTARVSGAIVTVAEFVAVTGGVALSVAETLIVFDPFTLYRVVKLAPVPLAGVPPVAVQLKEIGAVPPFDVAVHVTGLPTVPVVGQDMATVRPPVITMVAEAVAVFAFESVIVTLTVKVPKAEYVVVKLAPVPLAGVPPVAVHAKV